MSESQRSIECYLQSDRAREHIGLLISESCGYLRVGHGTWNAMSKEGAWDSVLYHHNESGKDWTIYFRPESDHFIVTDLGEGMRALRMRSGKINPGVDSVPGGVDSDGVSWGEGPGPEGGDCFVCEEARVDGRQMRGSYVKSLPDAICRVLLASYRVANLEPEQTKSIPVGHVGPMSPGLFRETQGRGYYR